VRAVKCGRGQGAGGQGSGGAEGQGSGGERRAGGESLAEEVGAPTTPLLPRPSACCAMMSACERSRSSAGDFVFRPPAVYVEITETRGFRGRRSAGDGQKDHANARAGRRTSAQGPQHLLSFCHPGGGSAARSGNRVAQRRRAT